MGGFTLEFHISLLLQSTVMGTVPIQYSREQSRESSLHFSNDLKYLQWNWHDSEETTWKCADHSASWHMRFPSDMLRSSQHNLFPQLLLAFLNCGILMKVLVN